MHSQDFFYQAIIFLTAAVVSVPLMKRLGLGSALGYLLAGVLIGPYFLGLVGREGTDIMHFAEFGVVMMLFLIGLELRPSLLWNMRKSIFGLGGLQMLATTLAIGGLSIVFGMNLLQAITIGLIFSMSSTAIVLQTLAEKGLMKTQAGQGSFSVLLFQDIAVIPILAILPLMANQVQLRTADLKESVIHETAVSALPGWQQVLLIMGLVALIITGGHFLARYVFRFIAQTGLREIFTASALLLVIGIAVATDRVGLSPALGTFLAGVVLADNEYRHELEANIEPFKGLLLGLFFITVGSSIDFSIFLDQPATVLGILGILILVKFFILLLLGRFFRMRSGQEILFYFALAQSGEFAFVLISFSSQHAILPQDLSSIMLIVVALSMLVTPLLLIINDRFVQPMFIKVQKDHEPDEMAGQDNPVLIAGFGRFGVVIGRFLLANGIGATILDANPDNIRFLRKFGFKVYYGDANRADLLDAAGADSAKVIIVAVDDREQINHIVEQVQRKYPHLKVYARAFDVRHSFELHEMDVAGYRRETYDSSLELATRVLNELGFSRYQANRAARSFRYHDELMMEELYHTWRGDRRKYVDEVRRFNQQLENILISEKDHVLHEYDHAWDIESRREEIREMYEMLARKKEGEEGEDDGNDDGEDQ
jgi:glutathione-regulated potassium-efflux system ancillary protein KefC